MPRGRLASDETDGVQQKTHGDVAFVLLFGHHDGGFQYPKDRVTKGMSAPRGIDFAFGEDA
jgi:hypothetical protein